MKIKPDFKIYQNITFQGLKLDTNTIKKQIVPLLRDSKVAKFFGVTDATSIENNLINHGVLILEKEKRGIMSESLGIIEIDDLNIITEDCRRIFYGHEAPIQKFKRNGATRLSFYSKLFGQNGEIGIHTIGLVYDQKSNTLYVMDSINDNCSNIQEFKRLLKNELFSRYEFKREFPQIIYSTKPQQTMNEYTCNNWSIANIEEVKKMLYCGIPIRNSAELDEILPNDINKILEEQYNFVQENKGTYSKFLD